MNRETKQALWIVVAWMALLTAVQSLKYLKGNPADLSPLFRDKYLAHWPVIFTHGLCAITSLAIGPVQFLPALRRRIAWHRNLGRIYLVAVLFGSITGFYMGAMAFGGLIAQAGFTLLATLWFVTGFLAYKTIRARRIAEHRAWMIRNFALTFGAVTLRFYLYLIQTAGLDYEICYPYIAWIAWIPNLIVAQFVIGKLPFRMPASKPAPAPAAQ